MKIDYKQAMDMAKSAYCTGGSINLIIENWIDKGYVDDSAIYRLTKYLDRFEYSSDYLRKLIREAIDEAMEMSHED